MEKYSNPMRDTKLSSVAGGLGLKCKIFTPVIASVLSLLFIAQPGVSAVEGATNGSVSSVCSADEEKNTPQSECQKSCEEDIEELRSEVLSSLFITQPMILALEGATNGLTSLVFSADDEKNTSPSEFQKLCAEDIKELSKEELLRLLPEAWKEYRAISNEFFFLKEWAYKVWEKAQIQAEEDNQFLKNSYELLRGLTGVWFRPRSDEYLNKANKDIIKNVGQDVWSEMLNCTRFNGRNPENNITSMQKGWSVGGVLYNMVKDKPEQYLQNMLIALKDNTQFLKKQIRNYCASKKRAECSQGTTREEMLNSLPHAWKDFWDTKNEFEVLEASAWKAWNKAMDSTVWRDYELRAIANDIIRDFMAAWAMGKAEESHAEFAVQSLRKEIGSDIWSAATEYACSNFKNLGTEESTSIFQAWSPDGVAYKLVQHENDKYFRNLLIVLQKETYELKEVIAECRANNQEKIQARVFEKLKSLKLKKSQSV